MNPIGSTGQLWPNSLWSSIADYVNGTCSDGFTFGSEGQLRATCSSGGTAAGSGTWDFYEGSCESMLFIASILGILIFFFYEFFPIYFNVLDRFLSKPIKFLKTPPYIQSGCERVDYTFSIFLIKRLNI